MNLNNVEKNVTNLGIGSLFTLAGLCIITIVLVALDSNILGLGWFILLALLFVICVTCILVSMVVNIKKVVLLLEDKRDRKETDM